MVVTDDETTASCAYYWCFIWDRGSIQFLLRQATEQVVERYDRQQ
jgi:hypothetical protein